MAVDNATILGKAWLTGTNDFQQRIPQPTQQNITSTIKALYDPMNRQFYNQFMDVLINRVGFTIVRGKSWNNVLAPFKSAKINYGSTIQEIAPKWIKAHSYEDDDETLLKLQRPEAQQWFHSQNRKDRYDITVNDQELKTAFVDEYGLNNLVSEIMTVPNNSDNYDEYRIMVQLIAEYENRWGFFKYHLDAIPTDEATGKAFLTAIRTFSERLKFVSTLYNAQNITDIPVFADPQELILLVTPETSAAVDVNTLSSVFQLDKANYTASKVVIDEFPIPNAVALLTTRDFFVCHDTNYTVTSFYNPKRVDVSWYLHHWGVYSVSPFVPAILFTNDAGSVTTVITQAVTGITVAMDATSVAAGGKVGITIKLAGTITDNDADITVAPDAATYELSAADAKGKAVTLNSRTFVDDLGQLHVGEKVPSGTVITVKATSTYVNPSGATTEYSATATVTVA
jgi:hypothetical protein